MEEQDKPEANPETSPAESPETDPEAVNPLEMEDSLRHSLADNRLY